MSRRGVVGVTAAGALALATLVGGALRAGRDGRLAPAADVPRFRVERGTLTRTVIAEGRLRAASATPIIVPPDSPGMQRIAWLAPDGAAVQAGEVVLRFDAADLERDLADGRDDREAAQFKAEMATRTSRTAQENLEADARLAEREQVQAERFAAKDPQLFSRQELIDAEIDHDLAHARAEGARAREQVEGRKGQADLDLLAIERTKADLKIGQAERGLAGVVVTAPHAGMLVLGRLWSGERPRVGEQVWPGQEIAEIPDPARMLLEGYVLEADAAGLKEGCRATLTVEAHPERTYPARVTRVSALAKRRHRSVPVQYFEVEVAPEETAAEAMEPGQGGVAEIVLEEIAEALAVPPQAVFEVDGAETVFRRDGSRLLPVTVRLGSRSPGRVQVLDGLAEGDEVALRDPRAAASAAFAPPTARPAPPAAGAER